MGRVLWLPDRLGAKDRAQSGQRITIETQTGTDALHSECIEEQGWPTTMGRTSWHGSIVKTAGHGTVRFARDHPFVLALLIASMALVLGVSADRLAPESWQVPDNRTLLTGVTAIGSVGLTALMLFSVQLVLVVPRQLRDIWTAIGTLENLDPNEHRDRGHLTDIRALVVGSEIRIALHNSASRETYSVRVLEVKGLSGIDGRVPWNVRWREGPEVAREIGAGANEQLVLVRVAPEGRLHFQTPTGGELFYHTSTDRAEATTIELVLGIFPESSAGGAKMMKADVHFTVGTDGRPGADATAVLRQV